MTRITLNEQFVALFEGSNLMIETLDKFFDSNCYCSCLPLVTQLLREVHTIANDLMDGIAEARKGLDHGDLYDIAVYDHYRIDTIVRFLEIMARHNPCDDYSKTCDITALLKQLYYIACEVNGDLAYIAYNTTGLVYDNNGNGNVGCGNGATNPEEPRLYVDCNDNGNGDYYYDDNDVAAYLREAIYTMAQTRKLTDVMFKNMIGDSCGNDNKGIYEAILDNIDNAIKHLRAAKDEAELEDFKCYFCDGITSIQTALGMLHSMKYIIEYFRDNEDDMDYCLVAEAKAMFDVHIYGPFFGSIVRTYKYIDDDGAEL